MKRKFQFVGEGEPMQVGRKNPRMWTDMKRGTYNGKEPWQPDDKPGCRIIEQPLVV